MSLPGSTSAARPLHWIVRCLLAFLLLSAGCLPQVGPPVDGGAGGGSSGGGAGGGGGVAASCSDQLPNGDETDVDCGGSCAPCAVGLKCVLATDCDTGVCTAAHCANPADACTSFSACGSFDDYTAAGANRTITFGGGGGTVYTPSCMRVKLGQTVTFQGSFSNHPLREACGPTLGTLQQSSGQSTAFTFDQALGTYGFYCEMHGSASGAGMAGAIEVVR